MVNLNFHAMVHRDANLLQEQHKIPTAACMEGCYIKMLCASHPGCLGSFPPLPPSLSL